MTKAVSNVAIATDTFASWVSKTNILLDALTNIIVTVDQSPEGSNSIGNGSVIGIFAANVFSTPVLRGGSSGNTANIQTLTVGHANATTSSNVVVTGYEANVVAYTFNVTSNTYINTTNTTVNSAITYLKGGLANVTSNVSISNANTTISATNAAFTGTALNVTSNTYINTTNTTVNSAVTYLNGGLANVTSNVSISNVNTAINASNTTLSGGDVNVTSNVSVTGTNISTSSNTNFTGANNYISQKLTANTITVMSNTYVNAYVVFAGNSSAVTQLSSDFSFPTNSTTSNVIMQISKSEFKSGKLSISATDTANVSNKMFTEISFVYSNTANQAFFTEYGIIYSNTRFLTFTANTLATNVVIYATSNATITGATVTITGTLHK